MKRRAAGASLGLLTLAGCTQASSSASPVGTPRAATPTTVASPVDTVAAAAGCAALDNAVRGLVPQAGSPEHHAAGDFELCKWTSPQTTSVGLHVFLQSTTTSGTAFTALAAGISQSTSTMTQVTRLAPAGFDAATGYLNAATHTYALLVRVGSRSVLLEGSAEQLPTSEALSGLARTLIG